MYLLSAARMKQINASKAMYRDFRNVINLRFLSCMICLTYDVTLALVRV